MSEAKKNISFTICDCNYLKYGLTLGESFLKNESGRFSFYLILVNYKNLFNEKKKAEIKTKLQKVSGNINILWDDEFIPEETRLELFEKYDIVEYCTGIKALTFLHFFKENTANAIYLDPDIKVYGTMDVVMKALDSNNIVLTPHVSNADRSVDFKESRETKFLSVGIFNLGFIGLQHTKETLRFLEWWNQRLMEYCYLNPKKGQFVDQNWLNFAPVFFEKVAILKDYGLNIAYWNFRERKSFLEKNGLSSGNGEVCFVHFSARSNFKTLPVLMNYLEDYESDLKTRDVELKSNQLIFEPVVKKTPLRKKSFFIGVLKKIKGMVE